MEWDAAKVVCLITFAMAMDAIIVTAVRRGFGVRQAIREWATAAGMSDVRLLGTSLRDHPQIGTAKIGDVTFRIAGIKPDGQHVSGFVKWNTLRRRSAMAAPVEAKFVRTTIGPQGFPVDPLADRNVGE